MTITNRHTYTHTHTHTTARTVQRRRLHRVVDEEGEVFGLRNEICVAGVRVGAPPQLVAVDGGALDGVAQARLVVLGHPRGDGDGRLFWRAGGGDEEEEEL